MDRDTLKEQAGRMTYRKGGADLRISGPSYKRTFVYLLLLEETRIQ